MKRNCLNSPCLGSMNTVDTEEIGRKDNFELKTELISCTSVICDHYHEPYRIFVAITPDQSDGYLVYSAHIN